MRKQQADNRRIDFSGREINAGLPVALLGNSSLERSLSSTILGVVLPDRTGNARQGGTGGLVHHRKGETSYGSITQKAHSLVTFCFGRNASFI